MYVDLKSTNVTAEFGLAPAFVGNFEYYIGLKQTWLIAGKSFFSLKLTSVLFGCGQTSLNHKMRTTT